MRNPISLVRHAYVQAKDDQVYMRYPYRNYLYQKVEVHYPDGQIDHELSCIVPDCGYVLPVSEGQATFGVRAMEQHHVSYHSSKSTPVSEGAKSVIAGLLRQ